VLLVGGGARVPLFLLVLGSAAVLLAGVTLLLLAGLAFRFAIIKVPHALSEKRSV
jgi:hypothetical protein